MLSIRKRKRKDVMKYDIILYDSNSYTLFFELKIPKGWMEKAAEQVAKLRGWIVPIGQVDSFVVTEGLGMLQAKLKKYIDQVVEEVRDDLPDFRIHSAKVEDVLFEKANDGWRVKVRVVGVYSA